jgi:hypothetical protein
MLPRILQFDLLSICVTLFGDDEGSNELMQTLYFVRVENSLLFNVVICCDVVLFEACFILVL